MSNPNCPWIEEADPLIDYYGLNSNSCINKIIDDFPSFNDGQELEKYFLDYDYIIDFCDYAEICHYPLLEEVLNLIETNGRLFWFPWDLSSSKQIVFDYIPPMFIETTVDAGIQDKVSRSFMQMQNGSYAVTNSNHDFYAVVVDGYYAVFLIKKKFHNHISQYLNQWQLLDEKLDILTASYLKKMFYRIDS